MRGGTIREILKNRLIWGRNLTGEQAEWVLQQLESGEDMLELDIKITMGQLGTSPHITLNWRE